MPIALLALAANLAPRDTPTVTRGGPREPRAHGIGASPANPRGLGCQGPHASLPGALFYKLDAGAFPGSQDPDVAVHVPPGFDPGSRPGAIVYFHGWRGCVANVLGARDAPCSEDGPDRHASDLARAIDDAGVNALLVAVELRPDMPSGEPGRLAVPGGLRELLRELFTGPFARAIGCELEVDGLDRVALVAHSGGYQAAASALALGDVPRITEVDLLDALYGADAIFFRWFESQVTRFDPRASDSLRLVDFYTCCGGTAERSRAFAERARTTLADAGLSRAFSMTSPASSGWANAEPAALGAESAVVFKEVPQAHEDVPRTYVRAIAAAAGFSRAATSDPTADAHIVADESHSLRPN